MNDQVIQYLNKRFGCKLKSDYYRNIDNWRLWWEGFYEPFHRISFENGRKKRSRDMYTMKMAKKVCEDWASILINDKTHVTIDDDYSSEFITGSTENGGVFGSNNFWDESNGLMERMMWSGTAAVVIRLKNASLDSEGNFIVSENTRIDLNYIDGGGIIPLTCDNGIITEAAFCSELCVYGNSMIYLELHIKENGKYVIENHFLKSDDGGILTETELPENVPSRVHTNSERPWFSICKPAIVNPVPDNHGMGCAVFYNAIDNLKGLDLAYNNFVSDIWLGQKKVFLNKSILAEMSGGEKVAPDEVNQQLFYYVSETIDDGTGRTLVQEHNPDLRVQANIDAVQAQLDYLSLKTGFGAKHYQFNSGSIVTATQYTGDKQDMIQVAHKHFVHVESFLYELVKTLLQIGHDFISPQIKADAKISIIFDQSPLIDEAAERMQDLQDVRDGLKAKWEYRMKWYGESEEQAKLMINEIKGSQDDDLLMGFGDA